MGKKIDEFQNPQTLFEHLWLLIFTILIALIAIWLTIKLLPKGIWEYAKRERNRLF